MPATGSEAAAAAMYSDRRCDSVIFVPFMLDWLGMGESHRKPKSSLRAEAKDVVSLVEDILAQAISAGASDIHFEPTGSDLTVKLRLDGMLEVIDHLPKPASEKVVARLKVLAGLLTYRNDIPQEGRMQSQAGQTVLEHGVPSPFLSAVSFVLPARLAAIQST